MSDFKKWYSRDENKAALSERRKLKYANDPELRKRAREYQANYRASRSKSAPAVSGLSREEVCSALGITPWVFNSWRTKGYFPAPTKYMGRVVMTEQQKSLIGLLAEFHQSHGPRLSANQRATLNQIIDVVHHNWES